ncbi:MAG: four helix bundle protein [Bacteroidota bacterium]
MKEYAFEKLEVWQISRSLLKNIYNLTAKFPSEERFGFSSQLRRASLSVSSNIAECSTRRGSKEQACFYKIAFGSLVEVLNQLIPRIYFRAGTQ